MFAKKNNGRVLLKVFIVLAVLVAAGFFAYQSFQVTARVKAVNRDTAVDAVTGSVRVFADGGYREIRSQVPGTVIEAGAINKGNHFKKNDALVQLDTTELDRTMAETSREFESRQERYKIELDDKEEKLAEEQLFTAKRLFDLGTVSEEQVKTAQRLLEGIRKRLQLAAFDRKKAERDYEETMKTLRLTREKMTIKAPIDGQVLDPLTSEGALIGERQPVVTIFSNLRVVSAKISEEKFGRVKIGQKANLRLLTYGTKEFGATVSRLLPTADETQQFEVWLEVKADDPDQLKPGSTGEVTITVAVRPNQIVIPRRALFGSDKVWVVKNGRVQRRQVKVGFDSSLNVVEILEGLDVGEHIIVDRLEEFHEGQRVRVQVVN